MTVETQMTHIRLSKHCTWNSCTTTIVEQTLISQNTTYKDRGCDSTASHNQGHNQGQGTNFTPVAVKPPVTVVASSQRTSVLVSILFCLLLCTFRGNFTCTQFNIDIDSLYHTYNNYYFEMPSSLNAYKLDFSTITSITATLDILQQGYRQANSGMENKDQQKVIMTHPSSSFPSKHLYTLDESSSTRIATETKTKTDSHYNLSLSTEENYESSHVTFHGNFQSIRASLDYSYHTNYTPQRQILQDAIIQTLLSKSNANITDSDGDSCISPINPWIVFTAGAMGSGKSYTIKQLHKYNRFPLDTFITVDPDEIRRLLPEFEWYLSHNPEMAGEHTRKEAGFLAEMLTQISLENGRNVLVDGSLKDAEWYHDYFHLLKKEYGEHGLRIGILHVTAPREAVFERARARSKITRRIVPQHRLEETLDMVPHSVNRLAPLVDFHAELHNGQNSNEIELVSGTWTKFIQVWQDQSCRKNIGSSSKRKKEDADAEEGKELDYDMVHLLSKM